ncbi:MAG: TatD DNase family protein [Actinomycetota bacterium]|nr:TatD DNase family protein [Actinomycetota bacterium]
MWFDSHCHLYDLGDDQAVAGAVARARAGLVEDMLVPGVELKSSLRAIELAIDHRAWAAVGIHPSETAEWKESSMAAIEELVGHPRVVAIGETGLDFYRDHAPRDLQRANFAAHIELAKRHSKALIIHTRESAGAALDMLEHHEPPERLVFHCWSGAADELRRALEMGAFVSFAGNISFKSAEALRDAVQVVPPERLMVETDSPYLTPVPHRGTSNEPAYVAFVGAAAARARHEPIEQVAAATSANARRLYGVAEA